MSARDVVSDDRDGSVSLFLSLSLTWFPERIPLSSWQTRGNRGSCQCQSRDEQRPGGEPTFYDGTSRSSGLLPRSAMYLKRRALRRRGGNADDADASVAAHLRALAVTRTSERKPGPTFNWDTWASVSVPPLPLPHLNVSASLSSGDDEVNDVRPPDDSLGIDPTSRFKLFTSLEKWNPEKK